MNKTLYKHTGSNSTYPTEEPQNRQELLTDNYLSEHHCKIWTSSVKFKLITISSSNVQTSPGGTGENMP